MSFINALPPPPTVNPTPVPPTADMDIWRNVYAKQHAQFLQNRMNADPEFNHFVEPPIKKIKWLDEWLDLHFKIIQRLVEEPMFAKPHIGEPVLEVYIIGARLTGPPFHMAPMKPFVRHYIDTEMVGETKTWDEDKNPCCPEWNEKMLVLPRGAKVSQFEVLTTPQIWGHDGKLHDGLPMALCDAAFNTQTLWKCAQDCGRYMIDVPLLYMQREVGYLRLRFRVWDGMPLEEEHTSLSGLGGTLAGALDNDYMREFGVGGSREGENNPFLSYAGMPNPMMPMGGMPLPGAMPMPGSMGFPGGMPLPVRSNLVR